jgi:hypothetical protein
MYQFVEGTAYEAIPALQGARRRMVVCVGRDERRIQFAWVDDFTVEDKQMCLGREIVQSRRPDGVYTVSSAVPLDIKVAAPILDLVRRREAV